MFSKKSILFFSIFVFSLFLISVKSAEALDYTCSNGDGAGYSCGTGVFFCDEISDSNLANHCKLPSAIDNHCLNPGTVSTTTTGVNTIGSCGVYTGCSTGYQLCDSFPNKTCQTKPSNCNTMTCGTNNCTSCNSSSALCSLGIATDALNGSCILNSTSHCATFAGTDTTNCVNDGAGRCATCVSGYTRCTDSGDADFNKCYANNSSCSPGYVYDYCTQSCELNETTLKLGFDSASGATAVVQGGAANATIFLDYLKNVSIGSNATTKPFNVSTVSNFDNLVYGITPSKTDVMALTTVEYVTAALATTTAIINGANPWALSGNNLFATSTSWNVGIGTTNPLDKLFIAGTSNSGSNVLNNDGNDRPGVTIKGGYPEINLISTTYNNTSHGATLRFVGYKDVNLNTWNHWVIGTNGSAGFLDFGYSSTSQTNPHYGISNYTGTDGTTFMRINSSGNVGIGTINPISGKLQVSTPTNSNAMTLGSNTGVAFSVKKADEGYGLHAGISSNGDSWLQSGRTDSATAYDLLLQASGGNVGIGTTDPLALLDVYSGSTLKTTILGRGNDVNFNIYTKQDRTSNTSGSLVGEIGLGYSTATDNSAIKFYRGSGATGGYLAFTTDNGAVRMTIEASGEVGIGTTTPSAPLQVMGQGRFGDIVFAGATPASSTANLLALTTVEYVNGALSNGTGPWKKVGSAIYPSTISDYVSIGTTTQAGLLHVAGGLTISNSGVLNLSNGDIRGVNKLTVNTVDPLYNIFGTNYSSFAASVVGGVKEEITGKINVNNKVAAEYQAIINFDKQVVGSDLWVWRKVVDFNKENLDVFITPYGKSANTYYYVSGNSLVFRSDVPVEISYRLIAKRFDWQSWPTIATDQNETAGLIIK